MVPLSSHPSLVMGIYVTPWWWLSTVVLTHAWVLGSWFISDNCSLHTWPAKLCGYFASGMQLGLGPSLWWFDSTMCPLTQSGLFTVAIALLLACDDQRFFYSIATLLSVCVHTVNSTLQSYTLHTYVHNYIMYVHIHYSCTLTLGIFELTTCTLFSTYTLTAYGIFRTKPSSLGALTGWPTDRQSDQLNGDWSIVWPAVFSQGWPPISTGNISCLSIANRAHFASGEQWWSKLVNI